MQKDKIKKHLIPLLIIIAAVLITYRNLPQSYFEQDEWHTFARFLQVREGTSNFMEQLLMSGPFSHFTPLSFLTKLFLFNNFGINPLGYFYTSIFLHSMVAILLYLFIYLLTQNTTTSLLPSLFFAVNSSHLQAVTWIGTFEGTEGAALFGLLFLILFYLYLKKRTLTLLISSLLSLLVALLFKEIAFAFFGPALFLLWEKRKKGERMFRKTFPLMIVFGIYLLLKFSYIFFDIKSYPSALGGAGVISKEMFIYNLISLPLKALPLTIVPRQIPIYITELIHTRKFGGLPIPGTIWISAQYIIFDVITVGVGVYLIYLLKKKKLLNKSLIRLALVMVFFGVLPFLILNKPLVFLDSRFFYIVTIGTSIFLAALIDKNPLKKQRFVTIIFSILIFTHMIASGNEISELVEVGKVRSEIVSQITQKYSNLPDKVIIYSESDQSYYGLPRTERILPFQSGFGQVLLVHYSNEGILSSDFFIDDFLWDISSQGYKEVGDRGFGYFRDIEKLKVTLDKNNLSTESVIAFSWEDETQSLIDISDRIRQNITQ